MPIALWQRELGIYNPNAVFARSAKGLEQISALQNEIHERAVAKVLEEGQKLDDLISFNDLNSCNTGFPPLVVDDRSAV